MRFPERLTSQCPQLRIFAIFAFVTLGFSSISTAWSPRDCKGWLDEGSTTSGVYMIQPLLKSCPQAFVYCDMTTDGGGWTIFQRRLDGSKDFYRSWLMYEKGFGKVDGEYWLGLSCIHALTAVSPQELRVDMSDFVGNDRYAKYSTFAVADDLGGYMLTINGYSGDAGNSMVGHNGRKFSTWDNDQDTSSGNCAVKYHGAWWYAACHKSNPNGKYLNGTHTSFADGVNWLTFKGYHYSLKYFDLKIRPL